MWLARESAAALGGCSPDSIERAAITWRKEQSPGRLRYKLLQLDDSTRRQRRYFAPDLVARFFDSGRGGMQASDQGQQKPRWSERKQAAIWIDVCPATIQRRGVVWAKQHTLNRIRYRSVRKAHRCYCMADVEALLIQP